ncbi:MAG: N-methylhydantoinase A [Gammaproteobacteria bacterium]|jgi:N-methylhydantoinase A
MQNMTFEQYRLAVDIGGTFTDVAVQCGSHSWTSKVLTTPRAPEQGVMAGITQAMASAGAEPAQVSVVIHGTTLATNAIIERKGASTALLTTEGFRDSVEMAYENRFEQYDINVQRPAPLVPRYLRIPVTERLSAQGDVLLPLDMASVDAAIDRVSEEAVQSVAIGLMHCYANPEHEQRVAQRIRERLPDLFVTLSSEVCPEIREYERMSTACANAYVQPLMAGYLQSLEQSLRDAGFAGPLLLMTSGGGLATVETAVRHPIRLVESGPAGGAILACTIARRLDLSRVLSFDMGGTTAKICLIDDFEPQSARTFEVDRAHRFTKGSGLPLRIPVIEMVEIGAGGGSIASVDALGRIQVGPQSAGSEPGPACYGRGGEGATVTDADVVLGRIGAADFAGGKMALDDAAASRVLARAVGEPLNLEGPLAALGLSEVVDENMANAARVHAIERGKDLAGRTLIAFGGAAPVHAARIAQKLGIDEVVIPQDAGVGSAIGFLAAPVSYEVVRSRYMRLSTFDTHALNDLLDGMRAEAAAVVRLGAPEGELNERRIAYMRYVGQGHEVEVPLPVRTLIADDAQTLKASFDATYAQLYGRTIPGMDVEVLTFALSLAVAVAHEPARQVEPSVSGSATSTRSLFDVERAQFIDAQVFKRLDIGSDAVDGPAIVVEDQTSTVVPRGFSVVHGDDGALILRRIDKA